MGRQAVAWETTPSQACHHTRPSLVCRRWSGAKAWETTMCQRCHCASLGSDQGGNTLRDDSKPWELGTLRQTTRRQGNITIASQLLGSCNSGEDSGRPQLITGGQTSAHQPIRGGNNSGLQWGRPWGPQTRLLVTFGAVFDGGCQIHPEYIDYNFTLLTLYICGYG